MMTMMMVVMVMMMMRMIIPFEAAGCGSSNNCTPASAAAPGRPSLHNTTHRHHPHNLQRPHNLQDTHNLHYYPHNLQRPHNLHYPHYLMSPLNYYLSNPPKQKPSNTVWRILLAKWTPPPLQTCFCQQFLTDLHCCTISFYSEIRNPSLTQNDGYGSDMIKEKKTPNVKLPTKSSPSLAL